MGRNFGRWFALLVAGSMLIGCGYNINTHIGGLLNTGYLHDKLDTTPLDLAKNSHCPHKGTVPLRPVNVESRTDRYIVYPEAPGTHYLEPKAFTDHVVAYLKDTLVEGHLLIDEVKGKEIRVSLASAVSTGRWTLETAIDLKIEIPEINYTRVYRGVEGSGMQNYASAYAVHRAIQKFLMDPVFQKYVTCR